jgi:hypothetical protein
MTNTITIKRGKKVEFTSDLFSILYMHDNSIISIGEVDHKSRLYKLTKFVDQNSSLLLTYVDDSSRV